MRIWRTRDGYLAEHGGDFVLVSPDGVIVRWFGSRAYNDEDDLWRWQHVIVGNRLVQRTTVERGPVVTQSKDELLLDDLVAADERHVTELIERALATDQDVRAQEELRAERAGEARVAAIVGDLRGNELGPELVRARDALAARVRGYEDAVAARLLGTLVSVARARSGAAVETAYARGCLAACFEIDADHGQDKPVGAPEQESRTALAAELAMRAKELEQVAEWQIEIDATRSAAAYVRAAAAIRAAARAADHSA